MKAQLFPLFAQGILHFTPTETGALTLEAWAYGGSTLSAFFDDLTISQA